MPLFRYDLPFVAPRTPAELNAEAELFAIALDSAFEAGYLSVAEHRAQWRRFARWEIACIDVAEFIGEAA